MSNKEIGMSAVTVSPKFQVVIPKKVHAKDLRVDRTVVTVSNLDQNDEDQFWWSRTPLERLKAIEVNRQAVYGYRDNPPRFQRLLEVARR